MATTCGKHSTKKEAKEIWDLLDFDDFSISDYPDPFDNPANTVITILNKDSDGKVLKINEKIVRGPDQGVHRYYYPGQMGKHPIGAQGTSSHVRTVKGRIIRQR
jgi:hypothetical protein